jgi:hypothetical protein
MVERLLAAGADLELRMYVPDGADSGKSSRGGETALVLATCPGPLGRFKRPQRSPQ